MIKALLVGMLIVSTLTPGAVAAGHWFVSAYGDGVAGGVFISIAPSRDHEIGSEMECEAFLSEFRSRLGTSVISVLDSVSTHVEFSARDFHCSKP